MPSSAALQASDPADERDDLGSSDLDDEQRRYRAPALEKGLDVLQLIAAERAPISLVEIVRRLNRSSGELFRMVQVLEYRGYIARAPSSDGYVLTEKLFSMAMSQPAVKDLMELALPRMRSLSLESGQSCHLARPSLGQIVIVARMESSELLGFSVRVGYRRFLPLTVSGTVLYAFQNDETRARWELDFDRKLGTVDLPAFRRRADEVRRAGHASAASSFVAGVTDISAPLLRGGVAVAALTIPFVSATTNRHDLDECLAMLKTAASGISSELALGDAST
ncbi:MAG TPA: IclR family transcriptional regulator [Burkholderiaceae bacterium]|jgi:DNA-binding IclR family transcriptional regulator